MLGVCSDESSAAQVSFCDQGNADSRLFDRHALAEYFAGIRQAEASFCEHPAPADSFAVFATVTSQLVECRAAIVHEQLVEPALNMHGDAAARGHHRIGEHAA